MTRMKLLRKKNRVLGHKIFSIQEETEINENNSDYSEDKKKSEDDNKSRKWPYRRTNTKQTVRFSESSSNSEESSFARV